MAEIILWLHLLEIERFQVSLTVSEVAEYCVANNTELSVVLRIETDLELNLVMKKITKCSHTQCSLSSVIYHEVTRK